ncbi:hypothetical protein D9M68_920440 [compost metagenome]
MGNGSQPFPECAARLPSNDQIASFGVEVHISRLREMPVFQDALDDLGEVMCNGSGNIGTRRRVSFLIAQVLFQYLSAPLHVLHGAIQSERLSYFSTFISKL